MYRWKAQSLKGQAQPALQRYVATASGNYVTKSQAAARKAREQMQTKQQPQQQQQSAQQQLQQRDAKTNESNRTSANKGGVPGVTVSQKAYQQEHAYAEAQRLHAQLRAQSEKPASSSNNNNNNNNSNSMRGSKKSRKKKHVSYDNSVRKGKLKEE